MVKRQERQSRTARPHSSRLMWRMRSPIYVVCISTPGAAIVTLLPKLLKIANESSGPYLVGGPSPPHLPSLSAIAATEITFGLLAGDHNRCILSSISCCNHKCHTGSDRIVNSCVKSRRITLATETKVSRIYLSSILSHIVYSFYDTRHATGTTLIEHFYRP